VRRGGSGCGRLGLVGGLADLEPDRLELARQLLDLLLTEVVFQRKRLEFCGLDEAALFGALDQGTGLIALQPLVQLILRHLTLVVLSLFSALISYSQPFSP